MKKLPVFSLLVLTLWALGSCGPATPPAPPQATPEAEAPAAAPAPAPEPEPVQAAPVPEATPPPAPEPVKEAPKVDPQAAAKKAEEKKAQEQAAQAEALRVEALKKEQAEKAAEAEAQAKAAAEKAAEAARLAALPVVPPPAPDLKLDPVSALQSGAVLVKTAALPAGTVVKYTLDGSDPASGKSFPASGLSVAQSGRLRVWAAQPGGEASTAEGLYTVGELWVSPGASGDGSWQKPLGTLDEGLTKGAALGIRRLKLMAGSLTLKTELAGQWELSGGWKALGELGGPSVLVGAKQNGSTQKDPAYTLKIATGAKVSLTNLEVRSPNSSFGAGVLVDADATLEVTRSRLVGGNGLYGYALKAIGAASVSVTESVLYGGDGGSSFSLSAEKSTVKVLRSTLDAGTGNAVSYGITSTLSRLTVLSSVVWGGSANSSYAVGLYSSEDCVFQGDTLLGGKGASSWALYSSESNPEIVGCLIGSAGKTKSYGIFANYGKSQPKVLRSNAFFGSSTGAFAGADLGVVSAEPGEGGAFTDASGRALPGQKGNIKADPALGPGPDYRVLASSPASLLKGSEPLTGEAALDRAGKARGASPAYGAWATSQ